MLSQPLQYTKIQAIGLKFTYPSEWQLQNNPIGLTMTPDERSHFSLEVIHLSRLGIPNPTLKDYAQYGYLLCRGTMSTPISDNQQLSVRTIPQCNMNIR
jgi:hypothetical protein